MILKICAGVWENASRDKRELSVYRELGIDVLVMAKGGLKDKFTKDYVDGFQVLRFSSRPLGARFPKTFNRILSIFTWAYYARTLKADIISGHDISGLLIGYLSNIGRSFKYKTKLIYDSHEFELGRYSDRSKIALWYIRHLEHYLIKRCIFTIVVNDCIANEVKKTHHLNSLPVVVRSTPNYWNIDDLVTSEIHRDYCKQLGIPEESFIIMYHGGVMRGRGIETIVKLLAINRNITGVVLGNGEEEYINSLKELAIENGVEGRILFHPAVPLSELWKYVGAANIGMIMAPATCKNHLYSLPNKFFENIQSETPVICPFYPAMKELVDRYNVGLTCNPDDLENINICVEKMRADASFYEQCKKNLKIAKKDLCWENEKQVLVAAYKTNGVKR